MAVCLWTHAGRVCGRRGDKCPVHGWGWIANALPDLGTLRIAEREA